MVVGDSNDCVVAGMNYKVRVEINVTLDVVLYHLLEEYKEKK